jgi:hypothetical protein
MTSQQANAHHVGPVPSGLNDDVKGEQLLPVHNEINDLKAPFEAAAGPMVV